MSAPLGYFSNDVHDFPELNKCPDCETFFADLNCPLCGKECPEEMRAGNRKAVKEKKRKSSYGNGRVQFVPWYYSAWFIILMLIFMPIVGLILLWTGYWKKIWKIVVTVLLVASYVLTPIVSNAIYLLLDKIALEEDIPVDLSMTESEYRMACKEYDPESVFRDPTSLYGECVCMTLTVTEILEDESETEYIRYFRARVQANGKQWEFLLHDYRQENRINLTVGDVITVYGQVGKNATVLDNTAGTVSAPCIDVRFLDLQPETK